MPLFAERKSFGGRMTSQAQAEAPLPDLSGLVLLGFPLHPAGKPSTDRADHLARISVPMLILQGTRDALADMAHPRPAIANLGERATLAVSEQADHAFHVLVRSGRTDAEILHEMLDRVAAWMRAVAVQPA